MPENTEEPPSDLWPEERPDTKPAQRPTASAKPANGHANGHDFAASPQFESSALPTFLSADVARWVGIDPAPLQFAIADLVPIGMVTLLVAPGGAGKSLIQQLAITCPGTGTAFLGHAVLGGTGAGLFAEDPPNILHLRQERINNAIGIDMEQLAGRIYPLSLAGHDARLWSEHAPTAYFNQIEAELRVIPDLRLLAIDNVSLVFDGNENDRGDVTRFLSALTGLADRLQIGILLSTHTSKSHSDEHPASGSTAWPNAARSVLELQATEDDRAVLKLFKANHAKPGVEIHLRWKDGVLVLAGQGADAESPLLKRITATGCDKVFLNILAALWEERRPVNDEIRGSVYAPRIMANRPEAGKFKIEDFKKAMERLSASGAIKLAAYGPPSKSRFRWTIVKVDQQTNGETEEI